MARRTVVFDTSEDVVDVVGEETTCVKHSLYETCDRAQRHVLCMGMTVPL